MGPQEERRRLGAAIAVARAAAGLTQSGLGRATGLGQTVVSRIESGGRRVDSQELTRIAAALGVEIAALLGPPGTGDYRERLRQIGDAELTRSLDWVPQFLDDLEWLERLGGTS